MTHEHQISHSSNQLGRVHDVFLSLKRKSGQTSVTSARPICSHFPEVLCYSSAAHEQVMINLLISGFFPFKLELLLRTLEGCTVAEGQGSRKTT